MAKKNNEELSELDTASESSDTGGVSVDPTVNKEKTKSTIALLFVFSFIFIIGAVPSFLLYKQIINVDEYKDIVLTLAGVLGGPLGIVITNYFRDREDA